jgi:glycosyltransferase involved in cell wall biosynthesis
MKISIIIPAHNEEGNIADALSRIEGELDIEHELVVVNDHSSDGTAQLVRGLSRKYNNIKLVDNPMDKGFANAIKTGFKNASCEVVVPVMADLCDDLGTIRRMAGKIEEGFDVVCGSRYIKEGRRIGGSRLKAMLSCWGGRSLAFLLGLPTHDIANAFKMYRKSVLDAITIESTGFEISMEIPLKAHALGFKITEVPTIWKERTRGKSSFKIFKLLPRYLKLYIRALFKKLT